MEAPLGTRAALLLALRHGPAYGHELVRRVARLSGGRLRIAEPHAYLALRTLLARGLVERWEVVPGGARGARRRAYYGLTLRGVEAANVQRATILEIGDTASVARPPAAEVRRMRDRLLEGNRLNAFGSALRGAMRARER
ncbi:MAG TPA: helix-turn-helix transcriptional regulator [Solirubrobacterales bacterium]|nr:helix-turn-helix transcriptional regulator [Solirubrobacterales bacterium]